MKALILFLIVTCFISCSDLPGIQTEQEIVLQTRSEVIIQCATATTTEPGFKLKKPVTSYPIDYTMFSIVWNNDMKTAWLKSWRRFHDPEYYDFTVGLCGKKIETFLFPENYTFAECRNILSNYINTGIFPNIEGLEHCYIIGDCEEMDHTPADSVTAGVGFSLEAPEISKKGDYYIFEQNFDCVQVYEDGNKFHISGPMPGDNQFLILKYQDGTGSILNMASGHWVTIYKDLCNVQIVYFWADPESYTFNEAQNMAKAIFAGAMVERPGTETCTVQKLCNPDALTAE